MDLQLKLGRWSQTNLYFICIVHLSNFEKELNSFTPVANFKKIKLKITLYIIFFDVHFSYWRLLKTDQPR